MRFYKTCKIEVVISGKVRRLFDYYYADRCDGKRVYVRTNREYDKQFSFPVSELGLSMLMNLVNEYVNNSEDDDNIITGRIRLDGVIGSKGPTNRELEFCLNMSKIRWGKRQGDLALDEIIKEVCFNALKDAEFITTGDFDRDKFLAQCIKDYQDSDMYNLFDRLTEDTLIQKGKNN